MPGLRHSFKAALEVFHRCRSIADQPVSTRRDSVEGVQQAATEQSDDALIEDFLNTHRQVASSARAQWQLALSVFSMPDVDTDSLLSRLLYGLDRLEYDPTMDGTAWLESTIQISKRAVLINILKPSLEAVQDHQIKVGILNTDFFILAYDSVSQESFFGMQNLHAQILDRRASANPDQPWLSGLVLSVDSKGPNGSHVITPELGLMFAEGVDLDFHDAAFHKDQGCSPDDLEAIVRRLILQAARL